MATEAVALQFEEREYGCDHPLRQPDAPKSPPLEKQKRQAIAGLPSR
jgi:hypothetical protein